MNYNRTGFGVNRFALTLLFLISSSYLFAQSGSSVVTGLVLSTEGEPLSGVSVITRNAKTNFTAGTTTDSSGKFTLTSVTAGGKCKGRSILLFPEVIKPMSANLFQISFPNFRKKQLTPANLTNRGSKPINLAK